MRIDILTLFPELFRGVTENSIVKRAIDKQIVDIQVHDIRDYTTNKHNKVDDSPYGGSAGMVMQIQPIADLIEKLKAERTYDEIIYTSPDGDTFKQSTANNMSLYDNIIILCGHYKGIDQRIRDIYITKEISIGDYVLTGGELAAAVITDSIVRLIPGVISDIESALSDSFQDNLLAPPVYTRPADYKGRKVPAVLLSGNHKEIAKWEIEQALEKTKKLRPDLLKGTSKNNDK